MYSAFGFKLIDEFPCAWLHEPVFPTSSVAANFLGLDVFRRKETPNVDRADPDILHLNDSVIEEFGIYTAADLVKRSTGSGTPWDKASSEEKWSYGRLDGKVIRKYFAKYLTSTR